MKQCEVCGRELKIPWFRWRAGAVKDVCGRCWSELVESLTRIEWEAEKDELGN